jgi:hypothetical protein
MPSASVIIARNRAWAAHGITLIVLGIVVVVLSVLLVESDQGEQLRLGGVLAFFLLMGFGAYASVSTLVVGVLAKRPLDVLWSHLAAIGISALLFFASCVRW